jgi:hypothetical protein
MVTATSGLEQGSASASAHGEERRIHLVLTLQGSTQALAGVSKREPVPERHPTTLATLVLDAMHAFLAATARLSADELVRAGCYGSSSHHYR